MSINRFSLQLCLAFIGLFFVAQARGQEIEPNNFCVEAQEEGEVFFPHSFTGILEAGTTDIDYFRFSAEPGTLLQVDLSRSPDGTGTLADPGLAVLDSSCQVIVFNDDSGEGLNARAVFKVPSDGVFALGVTYGGDDRLEGGGIGRYNLDLNRRPTIRFIRARLVDGNDGGPIAGSPPKDGEAELFLCHGDDCNDRQARLAADEDGEVVFAQTGSGQPLTPGRYRIEASSDFFNAAAVPPFEVADGESIDIGDIALDPLALLGGIGGRLVDALDGSPLPGDQAPFARLSIARLGFSGGALPGEWHGRQSGTLPLRRP